MRSFNYPARFRREPDGSAVNVSFRDLPDALTFGADEAEARTMAADCLASALATRIRHSEDIPEPSRPRRGERLIEPPSHIAAKAALYLAQKEAGLSNVQLARRLGCDEKEVRRLIDPHYYGTKLPRIEAALAVLGKRLIISVEDAA